MVVTGGTQTLMRGTCQMRAIQTLSTVITLVLEWNACKKNKFNTCKCKCECYLAGKTQIYNNLRLMMITPTINVVVHFDLLKKL